MGAHSSGFECATDVLMNHGFLFDTRVRVTIHGFEEAVSWRRYDMGSRRILEMHLYVKGSLRISVSGDFDPLWVECSELHPPGL